MKWRFKKKVKTRISNWDSNYFKAKPEEWKDLKEEKLDYIIEESRLFLQAVWESKDRLAQKASFLLAIITGLIGFIFTQTILEYDSFITKSLWAKILIAIYFVILFLSFFRLIKYQLPSEDFSVGTQPKKLLSKEIIKYELEDIAVKQLHNYQEKIDCQMQSNKEMGRIINHCFRWVILYPTIITFCYILFVIFRIFRVWVWH